jgi:Heparinase II/III-like protein.
MYMNHWYIQRLKTMTLPELVYRVGQWRQANSLKKEMGARSTASGCTIVPNLLPDCGQPLSATEHIDIFGIEVHPADIDDWCYDVLGKRSFPRAYAKNINIRTAANGSAKHVWELNRMLFLPRLAIRYRSTGDIHYITLIMRLLSNWVKQNPYLTGINWHSNIEINIRLINWLLTWEIMQADALMTGNSFFRHFVHDTWIPSIYQHCSYSYMHPSLHSSANNHLIAEYAGLFVASTKWVFKESQAWNNYAKQGLENEIFRQHSVNGINREEAAEYIQFITDFLLIAMLVGDYSRNPFTTSFKIMFRAILHYINTLLTINGQIPRYGDEDDGRVFLLNSDNNDNNFISLLQSGAIYFNEPALLPKTMSPDQKNRILFGERATQVFEQPQGHTIPATSKFYPEDGHFFFKKQTAWGGEIYCHFDAAPLGYLSIAAHGHADALSFVLYMDGHPFLVDPGTYCYHTDAEWRRYFVSTRAHNTICIGGANQAVFVGPTLWVNHYKVRVKEYSLADDHDYVVASHTGYKKYRAHHSRKFEFFKQTNTFRITDYIGGNNTTVEMPFHLHPAVEYHLSGHHAVVTYAGRKMEMRLDSQMQWSVACGQTDPCLGWYSNRFYHKEPSPVIIGRMPCTSSLTLTTELVLS